MLNVILSLLVISAGLWSLACIVLELLALSLLWLFWLGTAENMATRERAFQRLSQKRDFPIVRIVVCVMTSAYALLTPQDSAGYVILGWIILTDLALMLSVIGSIRYIRSKLPPLPGASDDAGQQKSE